MSYPPEKNKEYLRKRYAQQRASFLDYLGGRCAVCNTTEDLQIDHVDPTQKEFPVSRLWARRDLPKAYTELDKCQLLCEAHHIEKTTSEHKNGTIKHPPITHGTIYAWMKAKCDCEVCLKAKKQWHDERNARRRAIRQGSLR